MTKKGKKENYLPEMDMNTNPVWDVLSNRNFPKKKNDGKKKKKKKQQHVTSIDSDLQRMFNEIEEKQALKKALGNKQKAKKKWSIKYSTFNLVVGLLLVIILSVSGIIIFKYDRYTTSSKSMTEQVASGETLLYQKSSSFSRFDVVIINRDGKKDVLRVIGMPGDTIQMKDDVLSVNHSTYEEDYLKANFINFKYEKKNSKKVYTSNFDTEHIVGLKKGTKNIPERKYFLLGDNRQNVTDSRKNGLYNEDEIKGIVKMSIFPIKNARPIH